MIRLFTRQKSKQSMKIFKTVIELRDYLKSIREQGRKIGFVPTMGALHKGHLALIEKAIEENEFVVVSIFVNPKQFNNKEDLEKYPRSRRDDIRQLKENSCNCLFAITITIVRFSILPRICSAISSSISYASYSVLKYS